MESERNGISEDCIEWVTNAIYDAMGSYKPGFYMALGLCVTGKDRIIE